MKLVEYTDDEGKKRASIVRNEDSDLFSEGISIEPPPFDDILEQAKVELHNELVTRGIFTFIDVQKRPEELQAAVNKTITAKIILRLRQTQNNKE